MESRVLTPEEKEVLDFNIQELKEMIVKKYSYYMINQDSEENIKYLKYSVLSSWFSDINSYEEFIKKFDSFGKVLGTEEVKELFQKAKHISTIKEEDKDTAIEDTIKTYLDTISLDSYLEDTTTSGYSLPNLYLDNGKYKDYSIHKNIYFTNLLYIYLIKIDKYLKEIRQELVTNRQRKENKVYDRKLEYGRREKRS